MTSEPEPTSPAEAERIRAITQSWLLIAAAISLIPFLVMLANALLMWSMPLVFVITLLIATGIVAYVAILICLAWRRGLRFAPILAMIFITAEIVMATGLIVPMARKARCGAWSLIHSTFLRSFATNILDDIAAGNDLPPSLALMIIDRDHTNERFNHTCGSCRYSDVIIGRFTLDDYLSGRITRAELDAEAARINANPRQWERMGNIVMARDTDLWRSNDPLLITGFAPIGGHNPYAYNIVYADGHLIDADPRYIDIPDSSLLVLSIARARTLNLPEPPQDFLDAFGITEEQIKERVAEITP